MTAFLPAALSALYILFFLGSFDLAATRFQGSPEDPAEFHPADWVTREASHEVSSCGFWPGGVAVEEPVLPYVYPEPRGVPEVQPKGGILQFTDARVHPAI